MENPTANSPLFDRPPSRMSVPPVREVEKLPKGADAAWEASVAMAAGRMQNSKLYLRQAEHVMMLQDEFASMSDAVLKDDLQNHRAIFRRSAEREGKRILETQHIIRALAAVREAAKRTLGMEPYREQLAAGLCMFDGKIAEMATGEGKTLSAGVLAVLYGWRGRGCHVLTVNDYLAGRDAEINQPLFEYCGLRVASLGEDETPESRRAAYDADITYATNKTVAADYLRDRLMSPGRVAPTAQTMRELLSSQGGPQRMTVMRGLPVAIVDEADSILIDEAVTPLIISGASPNEEQTAAFEQAAAIARQLDKDKHYRVNAAYREVRMTTAGREKLDELRSELDGIWTGARRSEEFVSQALTAFELFHLDQHYVIQDGKIVIVDESTGRLMPDRTWRDGLHQAVEAKEQVEVQPPKDTLARVSFQRFFRMYRTLCGMTGTANESSVELWRTYRLNVVKIPTHRPCIRKQLPPKFYIRESDKLAAIAKRVAEEYKLGRPVLVGTKSVETSEKLSERFEEAGIPHRVLNAVRHEEEAEIVKQGGQRKAVTIATNMAGRGTDIKLAPGVPELGGLLVIAAEPNESYRIDRQLFGRSGRQGDPGLALPIYSLDDELFKRHAPRLASLISTLRTPKLLSKLARKLLNHAQGRAQRQAAASRRQLLKQDDHLQEQLGFATPE